jgi:DNA-binding transcriptional MerR regulator
MTLSDPSALTIGAVAERLGVPPWQVRRLFERGFLPPAARVGAYRVIAPADLPKVERALREAGYLPPVGEVQHAAP